MTRQDKTRQDKTRQDETRRDETRRDETRRDETRHASYTMLRSATLHQSHATTSYATSSQSHWHSATHTRPRSPHQSQWYSATHATCPPPIRTAQRGDTTTKQSRYRPIRRAKRIGHTANARERAVVRRRVRYHFHNRNEHGPAPRPPTQNQEPFATHSGKFLLSKSGRAACMSCFMQRSRRFTRDSKVQPSCS